MTVQTNRQIQVTRLIRAPRERVFRAWTDPEDVARWSCPEAGGVQAYRCDLRVGGRFRLAMTEGGQRFTAVGTYREVEAPARLVYTWDWEEEENRMGETLVTVEFREVPGGTEVQVTHTGFPAPEAAEEHEAGWTACLENLERHLG